MRSTPWAFPVLLLTAAPLALAGFAAESSRPQGELQRRIDAAAEGGVVEIGPGDFEAGVLIEKPITLRGAGLDKTVVKYHGNGPAILIRGARDVRIENLTVVWGPASTEERIEYPAAVAVRDGNAVLDSVALAPIDRPAQTPYGLFAVGRSDVQFVNGRSRGFAYALMWQDGAGGKVLDSDLRGAGHSVITIHPYSEVEVARNVLADCGYHALRVTGGTVDMHDNIIMNCKKAGAYLGNKDAHGRIYNNLFTGNLGEIWGYYGSDVVLEHNLFYESKDPAIIFWNTCALVARANSFVRNPAALRQYLREKDPSRAGIRLEGNHYWENKEDIQPRHAIGAGPVEDEGFDIAKSPSTLNGDPKFRDPAAGDFTLEEGSVLLRENKILAGPTNPTAIHDLASRHNLRFAGAAAGK